MTGDDAFALRELLGPHASLARRWLTGEHGVTLPPFIDHHVHLHLIDPSGFAAAGIAGVVDLGGDPQALARLPRDGMPRLAYAGAFLTPPGGYPSGRSWAPAAIVHEVTSASTHPGVPGGAATAVDDQATFGASVIKVALHADAAFDVETLTALVSLAHARGLDVVAHVQGEGMLRRALDGGVDVLAHTPFTARLGVDDIADAADTQVWISTLDIHRHDPQTAAVAGANLADFAAAGGTVRYGTDLGDGDLPVGVNTRELAALHAAGIQGADLVDTLIDPWPFATPLGGVITFVPGPVPRTLDDIPQWLGGARVVPEEEVVHDE